MARKSSATVSSQTAEVLNSQNGWHNTDNTPTSGSQLRMLGALAGQSDVRVNYPGEGLTMADVQAAARLARFIGADKEEAQSRLEDAKRRAETMRTPERFMWHPTAFELVLIKNLNEGKEPLDIATANEALQHCGIEFSEKKASPKSKGAAAVTDLDALFSK